jgi:hypothetical protein
LENFTINLFGKKLVIAHGKKCLYRGDIVNYIRNVYLVKVPFVVLCNGQTNFDCIQPSDVIDVEICLIGGGRKKVVHHDENCGPCYICKEKSNRYCHLANRTDNLEFVNFVENMYPGIEKSSCICRKCERRFEREIDNEEAASDMKKARTICSVGDYLMVSSCDGDLVGSHFNLAQVSSCIEYDENVITDLPQVEDVWLCRKHYNVVYETINLLRKNCTSCNELLLKRMYNDVGSIYSPLVHASDTSIYEVISVIGKQIFNQNIDISADSCFCKKCYYELKSALLSDQYVYSYPVIHMNILKGIIEDANTTLCNNESRKNEEYAFCHCVSTLGDVFLTNNVMSLRYLHNMYCLKLNELSIVCKVPNQKSFLLRIKEAFRNGIEILNDSRNELKILHWRGNETVTSLINYAKDLNVHIDVLKDKVDGMTKRLSLDKSDDNVLESALLVLRDLIAGDSKKLIDLIEKQGIDLQTISFKDFVTDNFSVSLWNFLCLLCMNKKSFTVYNRGQTKWTDFILHDSINNKQFMSTFSLLSICLYRFSNGVCNQPLPIIIADVIDKYTKSSSNCMQIFNMLGLTVSKDTLARFQIRIAEEHIKNAPFNDISRDSFCYASLDNLDFLSRNASVKASVQGRGLNTTTYLAGQPHPVEPQCKHPVGLPPAASSTKEHKPRKKRLNEVDCAVHLPPVSEQELTGAPIPTDKSVTCSDFNITEEESLSFENLSQEIFCYTLMKCSSKVKEEIDGVFPVLKVFLARKSDISAVKSSNSYIGILNECCDNIDTVQNVLQILHHKMEVGKTMQHLVVCGDGKTYAYLQKLKSDSPDEYSYMLPFLGDWHILKNFAMALFKIYGSAGLFELVSLLHKGRTENSVLNCSDFDKTFAFLMQTWEAMYRLEVEMYLAYQEKGSSEFNQDEFLCRIFDTMSDHLHVHKTFDEYLQSFELVWDMTNDMYGGFMSFLSDMSTKSDTFSFWYKFVHVDCLAYIVLYLAGRSANWNLRLFALKKMMPLFHLVKSTYYYKLIPQHIHDLLLFPPNVTEQLKKGAFVTNLSGKPWSSIFLDENHETTINKDVKQVVSSLSSLSINGKLHYLPYRAKLQKQFSENIQAQTKPTISRDSVAHAKWHEKNTVAYYKKLKCSLFSIDLENPVKSLQHLFSGEVASRVISESLGSLAEVGNERLNSYIKACITKEVPLLDKCKKPYTFTAIKNFGHVVKKSKNEKSVERFYKSSNDYNCRLIQWCSEQRVAPPSDIRQFIQNPMAIADPNGMPVQKHKSDTMKYYRSNFPASFSSSIAHLKPETLIIDAMVIIHKNQPLPTHDTFCQYGDHLFKKYVINKLRLSSFVEIHLCFDQQSIDSTYPKSIERNRRDSSVPVSKTFTEITSNTYISKTQNWQTFLSSRENKKMLVEFLGVHFIKKAELLLNHQEVLVVSGGYTDSVHNAHGVLTTTGMDGQKQKVSGPLPNFFNNHKEGDCLVWLHALRCYRGMAPIVIYSIDTDIPHIGMPLLDKCKDRKVFIQTKEGDSSSEYLDLNKLITSIHSMTDFRHYPPRVIGKEIQVLFVLSGCDYVSFFQNCSKLNFLKAYINNIHFVSFKEDYTGSLSQTNAEDWMDGQLAFFRLLACVYFKKCASSFRMSMSLKHTPSPEEVLQNITEANPDKTELEVTSLWLDQIRQAVMKEPGCESEEKWMPSFDSLQLHWKRCCYVMQMWQQADQNIITYPDVEKWGWSLVDDKLFVVWDSDQNLQNVDRYRKLWTSGCKCKSIGHPCSNKICGCKKALKTCGPACKCSHLCCNKPVDPSIEALMQETEISPNCSPVELQVIACDHVTDEEVSNQDTDSSSDEA